VPLGSLGESPQVAHIEDIDRGGHVLGEWSAISGRGAFVQSTMSLRGRRRGSVVVAEAVAVVVAVVVAEVVRGPIN
jgi:hypothetical protein